MRVKVGSDPNENCAGNITSIIRKPMGRRIVLVYLKELILFDSNKIRFFRGRYDTSYVRKRKIHISNATTYFPFCNIVPNFFNNKVHTCASIQLRKAVITFPVVKIID